MPGRSVVLLLVERGGTWAEVVPEAVLSALALSIGFVFAIIAVFLCIAAALLSLRLSPSLSLSLFPLFFLLFRFCGCEKIEKITMRE